MGGSGGRSVERKLGGAEAEVILLATSGSSRRTQTHPHPYKITLPLLGSVVVAQRASDVAPPRRDKHGGADLLARPGCPRQRCATDPADSATAPRPSRASRSPHTSIKRLRCRPSTDPPPHPPCLLPSLSLSMRVMRRLSSSGPISFIVCLDLKNSAIATMVPVACAR